MGKGYGTLGSPITHSPYTQRLSLHSPEVDGSKD